MARNAGWDGRAREAHRGAGWRVNLFCFNPSIQSMEAVLLPPCPDFRKDYTKLSFFKQRFPGVPLLALTATATPRVQHDVVAQVGW